MAELYGNIITKETLTGVISSNQTLEGGIFVPLGDGGTYNYNRLINKPSINEVVLEGNKSLEALDIQTTNTYASNTDIDDLF